MPVSKQHERAPLDDAALAATEGLHRPPVVQIIVSRSRRLGTSPLVNSASEGEFCA